MNKLADCPTRPGLHKWAGLGRRAARRLLPALAAAGLAGLAAADTASAQYRFGVVVGGASLIGGLVEYRWEHHGLEVQIGTIRGRDVSLSVTAKQYVTARALEPYVGAGLWWIVSVEQEGVGNALVARAPVGLDWNLSSEHAIGGALYFNRILAMKRPDPLDTEPPTTALVALPEVFGYRWSSGSN